MADRAGGCLCGAVRYVVHGDLVAVAICHCTDYQKQSGSAFSVIAAVPISAYEQLGATKAYIGTGDSGDAVYRNFCETCGAPILSTLASRPDLVLIKVGTLNDGKGLIPGVEVYTDCAADWLPALAPTRFPGAPGST